MNTDSIAKAIIKEKYQTLILMTLFLDLIKWTKLIKIGKIFIITLFF